MAHHTRDPQTNPQAGNPSKNTTPVDPGSDDKDDSAMAEELVTMKKKRKTASTKPKCYQDTEDNTTLVSEQPGPTKKVKTMATKSQKALENPLPLSPSRQSAQNKTHTITVTQKRKLRTKAQMEAYAAKTEEEK